MVIAMHRQSEIPRDAEGLVLFLMQQGSKSDAVQLYQEEMGLGRSEARRAVERLAHDHGLLDQDVGFADLILLVLMAGSLLLGFVIG